MSKQKLEYSDIEPISRTDALAALRSGDTDAITYAILSVSLHDSDWRWAQNICLQMLKHESPIVQMNALTGLSHIVRIHGKLDLTTVRAIIDSIDLNTQYSFGGEKYRLRGRVEELYSDINVYYTRISGPT